MMAMPDGDVTGMSCSSYAWRLRAHGVFRSGYAFPTANIWTAHPN
jgi:hypothetical protein